MRKVRNSYRVNVDGLVIMDMLSIVLVSAICRISYKTTAMVLAHHLINAVGSYQLKR